MTGLRVRARERGGFKLVELVVAVMIFATVQVGLTSLWAYNSKAFYQANTQVLANNLAREMIESSIAARYSGVDELATIIDGTPTVTIELKRQGGNASAELKRRLEVSTVSTGLKRVEAVVEWTSGTQTKELRLSTFLARAL